MSTANAVTPGVSNCSTTLVDLRWLQETFGLTLSRTQIYRLVRRRVLPAPIKLSSGSGSKMFFRRDEIEALFARRPAPFANHVSVPQR